MKPGQVLTQTYVRAKDDDVDTVQSYAQFAADACGSAPALADSGGGWFSGRVCGLVDGLKLDRGEANEAALSAAAVVAGLDPGHDRQA